MPSYLASAPPGPLPKENHMFDADDLANLTDEEFQELLYPEQWDEF